MIRNASPEDAAAIALMLHDFNREFGDPSPGPATLEPRVRRYLEDGTKHWLLAGPGDPHGLAQLELRPSVWSDRPVACLEELYVKPAHRGAGSGRALMEAALALARRRGAWSVELATGEDDDAARKLYESLGFRNRIEGPDDARALYYELELTEP